MKYYISLIIVGISLFSMFFGSGNLVFPLLVSSTTSSPLISLIGFILSGVLLPFYGVMIGIYFKGDYQKCLGVWGKPVAHILIFSLLFFWIPLGSGPRCNQLAYGAFCELGGNAPLWLYSLLYSVVVYFLTLSKDYFLEILGKVVTPLLIFFLCFLIFSIFTQTVDKSLIGEMALSDFHVALVNGYHTMDFIAAIFFSSSIIALLIEKQRDKFQMGFVRKSCLIAMALLTLVYVGMFALGWIKAEHLQSVSGSHLPVTIGRLMYAGKFTSVIFMIVTLSVLSSSMALCLVYANYLNKTLFREKLSYKACLFIAVFVSFAMSMIGFEMLSVFISYVMSILYPVLLITTTVALCKKIIAKRRQAQVVSDV